MQIDLEKSKDELFSKNVKIEANFVSQEIKTLMLKDEKEDRF